MFNKLGFSQQEIREAMRVTYDELISFVTTREFKTLLEELDSLDGPGKSRFVREVLLNSDALSGRGVFVPDGILIQRSAFGDRRPTLFCVKKYLPAKFHSAWENVNLTFDVTDNDDVTRNAEACWRHPVRPDIQDALLAAGLPLEDLPASLQVSGTLMNERWNASPGSAV